jgi:hypothetical protein
MLNSRICSLAIISQHLLRHQQAKIDPDAGESFRYEPTLVIGLAGIVDIGL